MNYKTATLGEIALVLIAIFVILAFFKGWG